MLRLQRRIRRIGAGTIGSKPVAVLLQLSVGCSYTVDRAFANVPLIEEVEREV